LAPVLVRVEIGPPSSSNMVTVADVVLPAAEEEDAPSESGEPMTIATLRAFGG
jgi:hypothetical protein